MLNASEVLERQARKKAARLVGMVQGTDALESEGFFARPGTPVNVPHTLLHCTHTHRVRRVIRGSAPPEFERDEIQFANSGDSVSRISGWVW